jgi:RNA polymerase sigma-70 factor (ECF subfamily)
MAATGLTEHPVGDADEPTSTFARHRGLLVAVAYRLLSSISDAEDAVQEAWLRWTRVDHESVRDPRAYLVRVTTRLALDQLRRRKARREEYAGEWLPEPILTGTDAATQMVLAESVTTALLLVLETLSPLERAVFVLREVFEFSHAEIADVIDRSQPAVRQLARRARVHVSEGRPRFEPSAQARARVTERFRAAVSDGDLRGLLEVLAPDVTLIGDGGGQAPAPRVPVRGADKVARFFVGIARKQLPGQRSVVVELNGSPGVVVTARGSTIAALTFVVENDAVTHIFLVANPEKLRSLHGQR